MNKKEDFYRVQVSKNLKDSLRAVAASRHIEVRQLTTQILQRFIDSRAKLLAEIGRNDNKESASP